MSYEIRQVHSDDAQTFAALLPLKGRQYSALRDASRALRSAVKGKNYLAVVAAPSGKRILYPVAEAKRAAREVEAV